MHCPVRPELRRVALPIHKPQRIPALLVSRQPNHLAGDGDAHDRPSPGGFAHPREERYDGSTMQTQTRTWEDVPRMPDDGNRYEFIGKRLHVTPAPVTRHRNLWETRDE